MNFELEEKVKELEKSLKVCSEKCNSERQGRIRAQQALRQALVHTKDDNVEFTSYPMAPIAIVRSCFSTRNGTPRQPLLVPLARAQLVFDPARVPPASLEGLEGYSHCWVIYVFHLNTNMEKLWKHPSQSKFKAKVRVPKLKGEKLGLFATRSPHRPCPIGLTVAKVEAVQGNTVLLSGVDLVDGTPVLDIKPYLPYCDNVQDTKVPSWVEADSLLAVASVSFSEGFSTTLADSWGKMEKKLLYSSPEEFHNLINQVLAWDIRSLSQRTRPHNSIINTENGATIGTNDADTNDWVDEATNGLENRAVSVSPSEVIYHLILEGFNVSYRIDFDGNVLVEKVALPSKKEQTISK